MCIRDSLCPSLSQFLSIMFNLTELLTILMPVRRSDVAEPVSYTHLRAHETPEGTVPVEDRGPNREKYEKYFVDQSKLGC